MAAPHVDALTLIRTVSAFAGQRHEAKLYDEKLADARAINTKKAIYTGTRTIHCYSISVGPSYSVIWRAKVFRKTRTSVHMRIDSCRLNQSALHLLLSDEHASASVIVFAARVLTSKVSLRAFILSKQQKRSQSHGLTNVCFRRRPALKGSRYIAENWSIMGVFTPKASLNCSEFIIFVLLFPELIAFS